MRVYLVEWFLHVPAGLRRADRLGARVHHDRGRRGYATKADAEAKCRRLEDAGRAAVSTAGDDRWERQGASLQHVQMMQADTDLGGAELAAAMLDDQWPTPYASTREASAYPWRDGDARKPWARAQRVLRHWAPSTQDDR